MNYDDAVRWVFGFTNYEFTTLTAASAATLQLARLRSLSRRLGNPERGRRTVHITGSKGKGSTARMIAALLEQTGARTGLFTSPHLHSPCERIMIDGAPVSEAEFTRLATLLHPLVEAENAGGTGNALTTFELLTAMAFLAFREHECGWQVVEVGLGGRLDATNVLDEKDLCVFTPISLEHTAILGPTTTAIAADKAGILRAGCRAVLAPQDEPAGDVLRRACADLGVPVERVDIECEWSAEAPSLDGQSCNVRTPSGRQRFWLPLLGGFQVENAATALLAIENLAGAGVRLSAEQIAAGFASVRWPGRLEVLQRSPLVLVDGAHNGASAIRLAESLRGLLGERRLILVVGTLADKDLVGIATALAPLAGEVIAVQPDHPRAMPAEVVAQAFTAAGARTRIGGRVPDGVRLALNRAGAETATCITGSLYVAAEARAELLGLPL